MFVWVFFAVAVAVKVPNRLGACSAKSSEGAAVRRRKRQSLAHVTHKRLWARMPRVCVISMWAPKSKQAAVAVGMCIWLGWLKGV